MAERTPGGMNWVPREMESPLILVRNALGG